MTTRILIIDDELSLLESIADLLQLSGYEVATAEAGPDGLQQVKDFLPNLILCDLMMPGMSGYDVLKALQSDVTTAQLPIVIISAKVDYETAQNSADLGAVDFLIKPFTFSELTQAIKRHLVG